MGYHMHNAFGRHARPDLHGRALAVTTQLFCGYEADPRV